MTLARELADTAGRPQVDKNLLINGGMNVWQRSTSASVSTDGYSTVDRFVTRIRGGAVYTISRSTDTPSGQGFGYSLKFDNTTADASPATNDFTLLEQRMEGQNLQHLLKGTSSAKALTLSFWIKSNVTGTFIARLNDLDNTRSISQAYTIDTASTWEKKIITFDADQTGTLDNDNNGSLWLQLWFSAGPDFTSTPLESTWGSTDTTRIAAGISNLSSSTSNELYITGIQLEIGEAATDFQFEPYESVLRKCQRYLYHYDSSENVFARIANGTVRSTTCHIPFSMKVTMRSAPTLESISAASTFRVAGASAIATCTSIALNEAGRDVVGFNFVTASGSLGDSGWASPNNTTSAFFNLSSEL
jgi:hypothetical protein